MIILEQVLAHHDPALQARLACDASTIGISVVLSYVMPDGSDRPLPFASQFLTKTESKYTDTLTRMRYQLRGV